MAKTKSFRIAVEGQTATDGRTITPQMIEEMVETFAPDTYGVRINCEHLRGWDPDGAFGAYGDVLALTHQVDTLKVAGVDEKRLALYAVLDPTDGLVELNRKRQKIYTSIEPEPNFGGTGKYGLVGLAVTDSPASLGTHRLQFSTRTDDPAALEIKADLDRRKTSKDSFFSAALETTFVLDGASASVGDSALEKFAAMLLAGFAKKEEPKPKEEPTPIVPAAAASEQGFSATAMAGMMAAIAADRRADAAASDARFAKLADTIGGLKADLEKTPQSNFTKRPAATGGDGLELADC